MNLEYLKETLTRFMVLLEPPLDSTAPRSSRCRSIMASSSSFPTRRELSRKNRTGWVLEGDGAWVVQLIIASIQLAPCVIIQLFLAVPVHMGPE